MMFTAFPDEITVKAWAISPAIHEAMTDGRRFHFKMTQGPITQMFTAKVALADEPGLILISDIRAVREDIHLD